MEGVLLMFTLKDKNVNRSSSLWMSLSSESELNFVLIELAKLEFGKDGMRLVSIERGKNKTGKEYITVLYTLGEENESYNQCWGPLYEETQRWKTMKSRLANFKLKQRLRNG